MILQSGGIVLVPKKVIGTLPFDPLIASGGGVKTSAPGNDFENGSTSDYSVVPVLLIVALVIAAIIKFRKK